MENKNYEMKSWRIDMIKSKRGEVKHVSVYTRSMTVMIFVFIVCIIAAGTVMIMSDPQILRISLLVISLMISLPFAWISLQSKSRLIQATKDGYRPHGEIDSDRYVIAMEYYGISSLIKKQDLSEHAEFTSDFQEKRKLREKKSIFTALKRKAMKKSIDKRKK